MAKMQFPPPPRDLRLDLFRGTANWAMFLGHVPAACSLGVRSRGTVSATAPICSLSFAGYTCGSRVWKEDSRRRLCLRSEQAFETCWQIYTAHVLLFMISFGLRPFPVKQV